MTSPNLGLETLGQAEVEQHGIDVLDVDHVRAVLEVIAHVDLFEARDAVKGGQHFQALQGGLGQRQLGARDFERSPAFVNGALADEVLRHQLLVALVVGFGNRQLGLGLSDLGALQLVIELHHHLALAHTLAVVEENLFDPTAHFGAQHHALTRAQTAHGLGFVHQRDRLDLGHLDRRGPCGATGPALTSGWGTWACRGSRSSGLSTARLVLIPPGGTRCQGDTRQRQNRVFLLVGHSHLTQVESKIASM